MFRMDECFRGHGYIDVKGSWGQANQEVHMVNVYALCEELRRRHLWEELPDELRTSGGDLWCVIRDFTTMLNQNECKGVAIRETLEDMAAF